MSEVTAANRVTIKQLLEAGVHFGHQRSRWNPKMKKYIFGERNGIYIINLEITLSCLEKALEFIRQVAREGKEVLFVGTKRQAQEPLQEAAERCSMPYVNQRWLGGMLTNFETVRKSVKRMESIEQMEKEGNFQFMTKKEILTLTHERQKLLRHLIGIRNMKRLPTALFVIDATKEEIAIREANKLGIPVIAVLDTNGDPDRVDYPIPGNDDAIRAIRLFCDQIACAILEGRSELKPQEEATQTAPEVAEKTVEPAVVSHEVGESMEEEKVNGLPGETKEAFVDEEEALGKAERGKSKERKTRKSFRKGRDNSK